MTAPKVGDRVRVTDEGEVIGQLFPTRSGPLVVQWGDGTEGVVRAGAAEVLPPPEPEWKSGDVVRDNLGHVFRRHADRWHNFDGHSFGHDYPIRPLTRLVPEGQS